jgi:pimeloyl-ACP methyl ester carboxylesterase
MVAQQLYFSSPQVVRALVLVGTAGGVSPEYREATAQLGELVRSQGSSGLAEAMVPGLFGVDYQQAKPERVREFAEALAASDPFALAVTLDGIGGFDHREHLGEVAVPTAVVVGAHDPFLDDCHLLGNAIPAATLSVLPAVGHMSPMEAPAEVAAAITVVLGEAAGIP